MTKRHHRHRRIGGTASSINTDEKVQPFKINEIINNIFSVSFNVSMILIFFVVLAISLIATVNLLILIVYVIYETVSSREDTIIKDTLKYKIIQYADFLSGFSSQEPLFMINTSASLISLIIMIYIFLVFICMLCIILYFTYTVLVPALYPNFLIDGSMSGKSFAEYISVALFAGVIFAIVLGVFHTLYMNQIVKPEVMNMKKKIASIDKTIKRQLNSPDNKFNAELFDNLIIKTKGTVYLSDFRKYIMNDYKQKDYAKAQQKIIMIILYSHLYDNIPDTNPRALQLVNYYFFKEPYIPIAEMEINDDDTSDLSFVSLLLDKNNVGAIGDDLINYDFYTLETGMKQDVNIQKVRDNVIRFFNNLNKELTSFTFQNKLHLFIWYIVIFFVLTVIALYIYMRVVYKMSNGTFNKPMEALAGSIVYVIETTAFTNKPEGTEQNPNQDVSIPHVDGWISKNESTNEIMNIMETNPDIDAANQLQGNIDGLVPKNELTNVIQNRSKPMEPDSYTTRQVFNKQ